jgi:hypothetical protein
MSLALKILLQRLKSGLILSRVFFEIFIYSCNYGNIHAYVNKNIEDLEDEKNKKEEDIEIDEDIIKEVEEEKNKEEENKNKKELIIDNFNNLVQEKILTYHSSSVTNLLVLKYGRLSSSSIDSIIIYDKKH